MPYSESYAKNSPEYGFNLSGYVDAEHQQSDANWMKVDGVLNAIETAVVALGGTLVGGELTLDGGTF